MLSIMFCSLSSRDVNSSISVILIFLTIVYYLGIQSYAFSGHKVHACKGIGGLILRRHGSSGGTEIAGILLQERLDTSPAYLSLAIDIVTVMLAGLVFGLERAMYTVVEHVVYSVTFSEVLEGINRGRCLMIVTEREKEIARRIMNEIGRGVTIMQGRGGWTNREKGVLYCVVTKLELSALKDIIREEDPHAFMCITSTHEIFGRFDPIHSILGYGNTSTEI